MARCRPRIPAAGDLEEWLIRNGTTSKCVFEKIFAKYDREYREGEEGGELVNLNQEAMKLQKLLVIKQYTFSSSSSDEGGGELDGRGWRDECHWAHGHASSGSSDEGGGETDGGMEWRGVGWRAQGDQSRQRSWDGHAYHSDSVQRLHRKVLEIKQEMNWDEEERLEQERKTLAPAELSSSDDEDTVLPSCPGVVNEQAGIPSGLESGYAELSSGYLSTGMESGYDCSHRGQKRKRKKYTFTKPIKKRYPTPTVHLTPLPSCTSTPLPSCTTSPLPSCTSKPLLHFPSPASTPLLLSPTPTKTRHHLTPLPYLPFTPTKTRHLPHLPTPTKKCQKPHLTPLPHLHFPASTPPPTCPLVSSE